MKAACFFVAVFFVLGYLGYTIGTAAAFAFCEHKWCSYYIVILCTVAFAAMTFFLAACLIDPMHAPEICHTCCSMTADVASDAACSILIDHLQ